MHSGGTNVEQSDNSWMREVVTEKRKNGNWIHAGLSPNTEKQGKNKKMQ